MGGSGGRITLFTDVAKPYQFNIKAKGGAGPSRKPCSWGAAGTIFYQNATSNTGFRVEINQEDSYKDPLTFPTPTYLRLPAGANLTNITGANGATITIKPLLEDQAGNWTYNVSGVKLLNGSRLTFAKSSSNIKTCNISLIADYHVDLTRNGAGSLDLDFSKVLLRKFSINGLFPENIESFFETYNKRKNFSDSNP